ncbi:acyl-CoA thioesterase [Empedobacter sp. UBA5987]|uniref:acyl-CoA thioesterase n=1 Tax=Empedobacter sp. UBA5987 TaxID=1946444 RepID=UPI0025B92A16|nr:thioesterase family protein [Empedobacter sp. UBA5987]
MARIKLDFSDKFLFSTIIPVRITDLNYGNHLANDKVLSIIHESRIQFFQHYGYSELDFGGVSVIMGDVAIEYKNQAFYGDELLIEIGVQDFSRVSFDVIYKISTIDKLIAKAKTGMVTFDYQQNKVVEVPQKIKDLFEVV